MPEYDVTIYLDPCTIRVDAVNVEEAEEQAYDEFFDLNPKDHWSYDSNTGKCKCDIHLVED